MVDYKIEDFVCLKYTYVVFCHTMLVHHSEFNSGSRTVLYKNYLLLLLYRQARTPVTVACSCAVLPVPVILTSETHVRN